MNRARSSAAFVMMLLIVVGVVVVASIGNRRQANTNPAATVAYKTGGTEMPSTETTVGQGIASPTPEPIQVTEFPTASGPYPTVPFTPNPTDVASNIEVRRKIDLLDNTPGVIIAQGSNTTPVPVDYRGFYIKSYRVEKVTLPSVESWDILGPVAGQNEFRPQTVTFNQFYKFIVTGGNVPMINNILSLYIGERAASTGYVSADGITFLIFDPTLLVEGSTIRAGFGRAPDFHKTLPETLHLNLAP